MRRDVPDGPGAGLTLRGLRTGQPVEEFAKGIEKALLADRPRRYTPQFANRIVVDGRGAYEFSGKYREKGHRIQCLVTVVRSGDLVYELRMSALESEFGRAKDFFRRVVRTLEITQ